MKYATQKQLRKATFEQLEERRHMSSVQLIDGMLVLQGNSNTPNGINVTSDNKGGVVAQVNDVKKHYLARDIQSIRVVGGKYSDKVAIDKNLKIDATVNVGKGDDKVICGAGGDSVYGGDGEDTLIGNGGNDLLLGAAGTDSIDAGYGDSPSAGAPIVGPAEKNPDPKPTTPTTPKPQTPEPEEPKAETPAPTPEPEPETPNNNAEAPTAVITALQTTVNAGHAVHVNGVSSTLKKGDALGAKYEWDFGDAGSKYNKMTGFNAAHIYEKAGSYTITLKVTNSAGGVDTVSKTVTVNAAARKVIYVSPDGNDTNSG